MYFISFICLIYIAARGCSNSLTAEYLYRHVAFLTRHVVFLSQQDTSRHMTLHTAQSVFMCLSQCEQVSLLLFYLVTILIFINISQVYSIFQPNVVI